MLKRIRKKEVKFDLRLYDHKSSPDPIFLFDALTSPRDYPKYDETEKALECERMSVSQAVSILQKGAGSHFDAAGGLKLV